MAFDWNKYRAPADFDDFRKKQPPGNNMATADWEGPVKKHVRHKMYAHLADRPCRSVFCLPGAQCHDISAGLASGLIDSNSRLFLGESDYAVVRNIQRNMLETYPTLRYSLFYGDVTRHGYGVSRHTADIVGWLQSATEWLRDKGVAGQLDFCYLDYCGTMTARKRQLNGRLSRILAQDAVVCTTLAYARATGTRSFKELVKNTTTFEEYDRTRQEIRNLLGQDKAEIFTKKGSLAESAVLSVSMWLTSFSKLGRPVLECYYAYVGGTGTAQNSRGTPMLSVRARFRADAPVSTTK